MEKITGIKVISFDADGTLWDFEAVMRHSLCHALGELERIAPRAAAMLDIDKMIAIRNRVADELRGVVTNLAEVRLEAFRRTIEVIGRPDDALARHLHRVYLRHRFEDIEFFPDVLPTLQTLRGKYILGLLSNGNSYPERCGLGGMFQFIVFSQDYGIEKPDRRLFDIAVEEAGCSKQKFLHVGDSLETDVAGAVGAGIRCVWLNRKGARNDSRLQIDYEITSLLELTEVL